ncbi:MAG: glycosyl hydrolase family 28 protein [candidate division KSB1 bacterium]|nr:glycosyl hydrolase family 28 protein [candidate division KSB1 bacterium]
MNRIRPTVLLLALWNAVAAENQFYPSLAERPTSTIYRVFVDGRECYVEPFRTAMKLEELPDWFVSEPYTGVQQEVHIVSFCCSGPAAVKLVIDRPVKNVRIRPKSRNIAARVQGKEIDFRLAGPEKLYIETDDLPPLLFFADPPEEETPSAHDPKVRYFGPGVHEAGMMTLHDGETLYLAPGALVYGGVRAEGARNIRILGRGTLDGGYHYRSMVLFTDCRDVSVEGVTIRNGVGWTNTLVNCEEVVYRDVKIISFGPSGDGINPVNSRRVTIQRCFFRCTDDCIAVKTPDYDKPSSDIRVLDNTMIGFAFSDGVTIGFETNAPIRNVTVRNCDILQARGGSMVNGHSAFSIICDGPALIEDVLFEDLRVSADVLKAFELHITDGKAYGDDPPGNIRNVRLRRIAWEAPRPIILRGLDETHCVRHVTFEDCTIADEPLTVPRPDVFQIFPYADSIKFVQSTESR